MSSSSDPRPSDLAATWSRGPAADAASPPLAPYAAPPQLGPNYQVLRLLGMGGMGSVWLARWSPADVEREVAVKLLLPGHESALAVRRFQRERRILARLQHPAIVPLLDVGTAADGRLFLTMAYIDGCTLDAHVRQRRPSLRQRLQLIIDIADAVAFAHSQLVVHRDLKPTNVMVDGNGRPHLLDFGIARLLGESTDEVLTRTGSAPLSPAYAAPEQIRGADAGIPADVFALGVIAYELLTGSRPFPRQGNLERLIHGLDDERLLVPSAMVLREEFDVELAPQLPARRLARALRGDLDVVLMRALAAEPARRYSSAGEFAEDLQRYRQGRPVLAQRDTVWYRWGKLGRRHWLVLTALSLGFVALSIGLVVARTEAQRARMERDRVVAARDFLLSVVERANPYQAPNPTRRVDVLFEEAAHRLVGRFPDDPAMEATLQQQFGRSLMVLERYAAAGAALQRAERLLAERFAPEHPVLLETRGRLTDWYRLQRDLPRAWALAEAQYALAHTDELPALSALAIRNDRIEVLLARGESAAAVVAAQQAQRFASAARLDDDYESVFVDYLQGWALRDQGEALAAAQAFIRLAERSLTVVDAHHPGLLTDLYWFAWVALDVGDLRRAERFHTLARAGRRALYATDSRYNHEMDFQAALIAEASGERERALGELRRLRRILPDHAVAAGLRESVSAWLALLDADAPIDLAAIEAQRRAALGEQAPALAELRLLLAAAALRRDAPASAAQWLAQVQASDLSAQPRLAVQERLLAAALASRQQRPDAARAALAAASARLGAQARRSFDSLDRRWVGPESAAPEPLLQAMERLAERIERTRAAIAVSAD